MRLVLVPGFLQDPEDLGDLAAALRAHGLDVEGRDLCALTEGADADEAARRLAGGLPEGAVLVGYSMGARLALSAALRPEAKLCALVLLSGSPGLEEERERAARRLLDEQRAKKLASDPARFVLAWGALPLFAPLCRTTAFAALEQRRLARLAAPPAPLETTSPAAVRWAHALGVLGPGSVTSRWDALSSLEVPALFLAGALDPPYADIACRAAARCPRAHFDILEDVGHVLPLEAPGAVAARIAAFCAALSPVPTAHPTEPTMKEDRP